MNFKPGDKVWVMTVFSFPGDLPVGTYAGVVLGPCSNGCHGCGWWDIEIDGRWCAHQDYIRPRDDPPSQQKPKREEVGSWDGCVWQPAREVA